MTQETKRRIEMTLTIEEILSLFPTKAEALSREITNAGLHCVGCHAATFETLEAGMLGHGMGYPEIERLVNRLNQLLEEVSDPTTITMTKSAVDRYQKILAEEGKLGFGIRFEEQMAGCSGFQYVLDYSEKALPTDTVFLSNGMEIHVDTKHLKRLIGSEIDYIDGLQGSGFKISNPNVRSSCGCGTSHGY
jgi:iron-sulfur cluster assembly accessory protein